MTKYTFAVSTIVTIELDENKFTPEFIEEFKKSFYKFDDVDEHADHLAQLFADGRYDYWDTFIEGYGETENFGIKFVDKYVSDCELMSKENE